MRAPTPLLRVRPRVYSKVPSQEPATLPQDVSAEFAVGGWVMWDFIRLLVSVTGAGSWCWGEFCVRWEQASVVTLSSAKLRETLPASTSQVL